MTKDSRKRMLDELRGDLDECLERRKQLDKEIARLRVAIVGLERVVMGESPEQKREDLQSLLRLGTKGGLKDMVIEVLRGADGPLTATEVVRGLDELRFDFGENVSKLGVVTVTLARLAKSGEAETIGIKGKKAYRWRG
jgi:hypothetical protein